MTEAKPGETKTSEMKPKKVVGMNVAIALGIICIILIAGLGVVIYMSYSPIASTSSTSLQNQLNDLNATYNSYVSTHSHTDSDYETLNTMYTNLQTQNTNLQNQVNDLTSNLNLAKSTVLVDSQTVSQPAGGLGIAYTSWPLSADFAGYVSINVLSSTTTSTYARVVYSAYGVNYDNHINVGTSGTAVFPILPCSNIQVEVGNGNLVNGATETVTITYYY